VPFLCASQQQANVPGADFPLPCLIAGAADISAAGWRCRALAATPLGSVTVGGSIGDAGRRKFFFTFGRLF
jgi:hypothetical protein